MRLVTKRPKRYESTKPHAVQRKTRGRVERVKVTGLTSENRYREILYLPSIQPVQPPHT